MLGDVHRSSNLEKWSRVPNTNVFLATELVGAIREHNPDAEMPMIEVADLAPHKLKRWHEIEHYGQCGHKSDFGSLLNFTVWMLFYVDYENDGNMIDRVAENAICESADSETFESHVGGVASLLKSHVPDFLVLPQTYTVAVRVYHGWIETPRIRYNLRSTLVWESKDRLMALHTRHDV